MADAGARKIKDLLETPSKTLATRTDAVRSGLSRARGAEGAVPSSTYRAITELRSHYRRLHLEIEDTKTRSSAKKDVTAALFQIESALASLSQGVRQGTDPAALDQLRKARRRASRGASDLRRAAERLT